MSTSISLVISQLLVFVTVIMTSFWVVFTSSFFRFLLFEWIRSLLRSAVTPAPRAAMRLNFSFLKETFIAVMRILPVCKQQVISVFPVPLSSSSIILLTDRPFLSLVFPQLRFSDASNRECFFSAWACIFLYAWGVWCYRGRVVFCRQRSGFPRHLCS